MEALTDYVDRVSDAARLIVASTERPYDVALRIWALSMDSATRRLCLLHLGLPLEASLGRND